MFYYFPDGNTFLSKIEAIKYSYTTQKQFKFYYYDEVYSKLNWSVEPPETLDYYYLEQAKKIRDEYDYVILCYSGGYDSTNILEIFHYNNIKLDKIVVVGAFSKDLIKGSDENHNGELYLNSFPYLKFLNLENITQVCDYSVLFENINNFSISDFEENWVDVIGTRVSPHHWFWKDLEKHVVPKQYENKKVAIIFGKEKPKLFWNKNGFILFEKEENAKAGFCFSDDVTHYGNVVSNNYIKRINFYWDPNYPLILIKQLHIMKKFLDLNNLINLNILINNEKNINLLNHNIFNSGDNLKNSVLVDSIIYNLKHKLNFKSPKSQNVHISLRDAFLFNKKNLDILKFYYNGMIYIKKKTNYTLGGPKFHISTLSKFYEIE